ncbi:MAG: hypothetical protein LC126_12380 [Bryobacterales bacterium]|nr:hypothetical protein [Bryobacterales bacterium]
MRDYVERGGSLIATHETSCYDECGNRSDDFGLAELFGVHYAGRIEGPMKNVYLRLQNHGSPLLRGLEDAPRIIHGVHRPEVTACATFVEKPLTLIPSYPDLSMGMVSLRADRTASPKPTCVKSVKDAPSTSTGTSTTGLGK